MIWRLMHRWLGLTLGSVALLLALTGLILATQPAVDAFKAVPAASDLSVATLAERVNGQIAGVEQIRRLPSGDIVVYSFDAGQAQAARVDPADGRVIESWQPSAFSRWVKNLHRSFLLGDAGRIAAAAVALGMLLISVSGLVLMARRLGGLRHLMARVRGSGLQRLHVVTGRVVLAVLMLTSITALYMSAATFGWVASASDFDPDVVSQAFADGADANLAPQALPLLRELQVRKLRKLNVPSAYDPEDTWQVATDGGEGWIDRSTGQTLAWQDAPATQRIYDWVYLLHTGEGAWAWALVLGLMAASIPMFWATGLLLWLQGRRQLPRIRDNSAARDAQVLIFVASENGSTWGFAEALHRALVHAGQRVHTGPLEQFQVGAAARQVFVLAATYGDGQAPAHAAKAMARIQAQLGGEAPVTVLGFGDRQFTAYCAFAEAVDAALRAQGWPELLPLERIHQQSVQQFARWGQALSAALQPMLGQELAIDYLPRVPATTPLTLVARQDFKGELGYPAAILRFTWPAQGWLARVAGRGLPHFAPGDLVGIMAPGAHVPRYYSLASGWRDGFLEICVRKLPEGACSSFLHGLQPGDTAQVFIKANPSFVLERPRAPVLLIGAGTGVAPLAGFIRGNRRRTPMHLFFGARDPARDFYFGPEMERWLTAGQLATLRTAFSRVEDGGGYVQDALRRDAKRIQELVQRGAIVRVCGSRPMAQGVADALNDILGAVKLSVQQLKTGGAMPKTCSEAALRRLKLNGPTMGTRWSFVGDVDPRVDEAALQRDLAAAVDKVDRQMSPWKPESALMRLNAAPVDVWVPLPPDILAVLARALQISRQSDGAFDPAVGALVDAWGFGAPREAPDASAIRAAGQASARPAHRWLELDTAGGRARKHAPLKLDLCGIAKGHAVDLMVAAARAHGIQHALAGLDGELRAIGQQASGAPWAVGLEAPQADQRGAQAVIELADLAVATSGDYRHFTQIANTRIAHSMDGRSNAPVNNGVASVTVLAVDCMSADAWATALLVAGVEDGPALVQHHGLEALFLLRRGDRLIELGFGRFASGRQGPG